MVCKTTQSGHYGEIIHVVEESLSIFSIQVRDPKFYITSSSQRKNTLQGYMPFIYTPADVVSAELVPGKAPEEAGVRVAWPDHSSTFNASWLRAQDMSLNRTSFPKLYEEKLWSTQKDLPEYQYGEREERMEGIMIYESR